MPSDPLSPHRAAVAIAGGFHLLLNLYSIILYFIPLILLAGSFFGGDQKRKSI
ncbi:hypothetical protein ASZ90_018683 [hydrocarbon metagenome]|uniref:Uncharacterized protein n=1 Tax=hydrocarbon metagenome TaxID=938273 RepID=A0A0W8E5L4_9ZZZZ